MTQGGLEFLIYTSSTNNQNQIHTMSKITTLQKKLLTLKNTERKIRSSIELALGENLSKQNELQETIAKLVSEEKIKLKKAARKKEIENILSILTHSENPELFNYKVFYKVTHSYCNNVVTSLGNDMIHYLLNKKMGVSDISNLLKIPYGIVYSRKQGVGANKVTFK